MTIPMGAVAAEIDVTGTQSAESPAHVWQLVTDLAAPVAVALSGADDATRERIRASLIEQVQSFADGDGRVHMPYTARVTVATKAG